MTIKNTHKRTFFYIRSDVLVWLFLIIATLTVYWQVLSHEFVNCDDPSYVSENPHVQTGLTLEGIAWSFTSTRAGNWHPLTWLSHMLDIESYGLSPGGHHFTNVLFHIANTLLLFLVFRRMTGDLWRSGFIAALFSLHPLHVESVAWVAERKDVLSTFFWMLTMWSYVRYVEHPGGIRYLVVLLFFVLGLMAKPMLVTLPFVLLLLDYWPLKRLQFGQLRGDSNTQQRLSVLTLIWEKTPLFALTAASSIVTFLVQQSGGAVGSFTAYPLNVRIANALVSYVSYIGKMIWPYHLAVLYPHPRMFPWLLVAGACLLIVFIFFLVIVAVKRHPWFAVGWLWYIGTLMPVIGLVQIGSQAMADRYTYIPLIGIFIIIAWGFPELVSRWRYRKIGLSTIVVACLSAIMVTTCLQVRYWRNSITLFEHTLNVTANNYVAHSNLGIALFFQGKRDEAMVHFHKALHINPGFADARTNLGIVLANKGRMTEAISHFSEVLRINPDSYEAHNNLGVALERQGNTAEAVKHYSEALRINPDFDEAHNNLGAALASQGKLDEAIDHYSEALRINPRFAKVHNNLGIALIRKGKLEEAVFHFRDALRIKPDYANAHNNLERALALLRK
ncbi:MAG: tetratricopeptide repeat protein [Desulfobacteraceae bacterium]|nr:tetratricopeptide repeat protein [Desulfobacteraceae bacterium]